MNIFLLQTQQIIDTASVLPIEHKLSIWELMTSGGIGAQLVMATLLILSIVAVYIFIERYGAIKKAQKTDVAFMNNITEFVHANKLDASKALCQTTDTPVARMIDKGLSKLGKPHIEIDQAIESMGKLEIYKLEAKMSALATISGVAPMIGFLGTVLGMIRAFFNLSHSGSNIDPTLLAGGIYEALVTTAAGLLIGIMAYWFYNLLVNMVEKVVFQMEVTSIEFIDSIPENN